MHVRVRRRTSIASACTAVLVLCIYAFMRVRANAPPATRLAAPHTTTTPLPRSVDGVKFVGGTGRRAAAGIWEVGVGWTKPVLRTRWCAHLLRARANRAVIKWLVNGGGGGVRTRAHSPNALMCTRDSSHNR